MDNSIEILVDGKREYVPKEELKDTDIAFSHYKYRLNPTTGKYEERTGEHKYGYHRHLQFESIKSKMNGLLNSSTVMFNGDEFDITEKTQTLLMQFIAVGEDASFRSASNKLHVLPVNKQKELLKLITAKYQEIMLKYFAYKDKIRAVDTPEEIEAVVWN